MTGFRPARGEFDDESDRRPPTPVIVRAPERRADPSEIEARLDRLLHELEELRREIRR